LPTNSRVTAFHFLPTGNHLQAAHQVWQVREEVAPEVQLLSISKVSLQQTLHFQPTGDREGEVTDILLMAAEKAAAAAAV